MLEYFYFCDIHSDFKSFGEVWRGFPIFTILLVKMRQALSEGRCALTQLPAIPLHLWFCVKAPPVKNSLACHRVGVHLAGLKEGICLMIFSNFYFLFSDFSVIGKTSWRVVTVKVHYWRKNGFLLLQFSITSYYKAASDGWRWVGSLAVLPGAESIQLVLQWSSPASDLTVCILGWIVSLIHPVPHFITHSLVFWFVKYTSEKHCGKAKHYYNH